ncbi:MAG: ABC transporter permease subunit [Desulfobacter sp.]|nr:MAG: ABC transporter permease subunit [Desulfobacter sp.]
MGKAAAVNGQGWGDRFLTAFSWACAAVLVTALTLIIGFLVVKGGGRLNGELVFGSTPVVDALLLRRQVFDGLFPAMAGTLMLVCLAMAVALPLGLATGIYLAEYARGTVKLIFSLMVDILAGIPSIVVGLFGFSITISLHHFFNARIFPCLMISGLALGFLVLPYIVKTTQAALEGLPLQVRLTAPGLGASRLENLFYVLLPAALSDIVSGIVLALGRCAEDTAVIMLTGVVATAGVPKSLFSGFEALPFYIYYIASEYTDPSELGTGYGAALILLILCTGLFVLAHWIRYHIEQKMKYRY